jgi:hypothetical protein
VVATTWKDWFGLRPNGSSFNNKREYANVLFVNKSDATKLAGHSSKVPAGVSVREQECIFFEHERVTYLACPINSVQEAVDQVDTVFCLSVAEDHSFVAEGAVVHNCEHDVCSICNNEAPTRKDYCKHVKKLAKAPYGMGKILDDGRKCHVFNPKGVFNDISKVPVGADMIAQQLRKVAGLDEEIIGGAELADSMFPELSREKHASKIAVATKLSRMEKLVPFSAQRVDLEDKIPEKTAAALREMPVSKMFGELAKLGCLLPFRSFFGLIMGEKVAELEPHLSEGEKAAHRVFDFVTSSDAILDEVCGNGAFECAVPPIPKLGVGESKLMSYEFGMEPSLAADRMVKNAICASRTIEPTEASSISVPARELLKQYASYKIAALESGSFVLSDDLFYVAAATF